MKDLNYTELGTLFLIFYLASKLLDWAINSGLLGGGGVEYLR